MQGTTAEMALPPTSPILPSGSRLSPWHRAHLLLTAWLSPPKLWTFMCLKHASSSVFLQVDRASQLPVKIHDAPALIELLPRNSYQARLHFPGPFIPSGSHMTSSQPMENEKVCISLQGVYNTTHLHAVFCLLPAPCQGWEGTQELAELCDGKNLGLWITALKKVTVTKNRSPCAWRKLPKCWSGTEKGLLQCLQEEGWLIPWSPSISQKPSAKPFSRKGEGGAWWVAANVLT